MPPQMWYNKTNTRYEIMKKIQGFTLSEILIALLVLGIIVAASVPLIMDLAPNKNAIMIKKAYYTTETIVNALINDTTYYPEYKDDGTSYVGFDNREQVTSPIDASKNIKDKAKFPCLFASKLNIKDSIHKNGACTGTTGVESVTTNDGMVWNLAGLETLGTDEDTEGHIEIDVDGLGSNTNTYNFDGGTGLCASEDAWYTTCDGEINNRQKKRFDRISIIITPSGQIKIEDQEAFQNIINGTTKLIGGDD